MLVAIGGGALARQPQNRAEAIATAKALRVAGWNFSVGLGQINVGNFERLGLTVERGIRRGYEETYEWFCASPLVDAPDQLSDPVWGAGYDFALEAQVAEELTAKDVIRAHARDEGLEVGQHLLGRAPVVKIKDLAALRVEDHEAGQGPRFGGRLDLQGHIGQGALGQQAVAFKCDVPGARE